MKKLVILVVSLQVVLSAQVMTSAALGMGLNYTAKARGTDALGWNPANLGMIRDYASEISFLSFSTTTANNSFSWSDINKYFQKGKFLGEQEKLDFLSAIPEDGLLLDSDISLNLVSFVYGRYGFSLSGISSAKGVLPEEFFDLALFPNQLGKVYDFTSVDARGFSAIRASFAYSQWFTFIEDLPLSLGGQFNYYVGMGVIQTTDAGAIISQDSLGVIPPGSYYSLRGRTAGPGGSGFSLDLGVATFMLDNKLDLSFSIKNLFASIHWSGKTEEFMTIGHLDSLSLGDLVDGNYPKEDTTRSIGDFSTPLPITMNFGAAFRFSDQLTVTGDWKQGLNESFGNTLVPQIGVGVEYLPLDYLPLRAGITFGGRVGSLYSIGAGLKYESFCFDGAFGMSRGILPTSSTGFIGSFSFRIKM